MVEIEKRLLKIIPLLASDKDGEVLAAVHALNRALAESKYDWHDVVRAITNDLKQPKSNQTKETVRKPPEWRLRVDELLFDCESLTYKQEQFLENLQKWRGLPTLAQMKYLNGLYERYKQNG